MNEILLLLIFGYIFIAALLALAIIHSELDWRFKGAMIIVVSIFYYISYHSWTEAQGWPSNTYPPEQFVLHHALVVEPDQEKETEGQILVWLSEIQDKTMSDTPRVYRIEYSRTLHSKVEKALSKLKGGKAQVGRIGNKERKFQSELSGSIAKEEETMIVFSDLPDLALPEK